MVCSCARHVGPLLFQRQGRGVCSGDVRSGAAQQVEEGALFVSTRKPTRALRTRRTQSAPPVPPHNTELTPLRLQRGALPPVGRALMENRAQCLCDRLWYRGALHSFEGALRASTNHVCALRTRCPLAACTNLACALCARCKPFVPGVCVPLVQKVPFMPVPTMHVPCPSHHTHPILGVAMVPLAGLLTTPPVRCIAQAAP